MQKIFVPVFLGLPKEANHFAPLLRIVGTTAIVSTLFTIVGASTLIYCGIQERYPWDYKLLVWTGWILPIEIIIHYIYLPINSQPSYDTVAKGSIILATVEAVATLFFLIIFLDLIPY